MARCSEICAAIIDLHANHTTCTILQHFPLRLRKNHHQTDFNCIFPHAWVKFIIKLTFIRTFYEAQLGFLLSPHYQPRNVRNAGMDDFERFIPGARALVDQAQTIL